MRIFESIGKYFTKAMENLGGLVILLWDVARWLVRPPYRQSVLMQHMEFIGVQSLPVVVMTGLFTGMVFAYQSYFGFSMFGAETMTGTVVALAMARELGPVLSSIMVTARAGSAMTAELGTMRVTEQIDALYAIAIEPLQYLVAPRILASVFMMPLLSFISVAFGILGGYLVGVKGLDINATLYLQNTFNYLKFTDILNGTVKATTFGLILSTVGCYKGFYAKGGALGVGRATTESVVVSCVLILIFDYVLTAIMF